MSDFVGYKLRLYSGIINLAASAFLITGCSSDPITLPKSEQYNREFIKTFGVFDRTHDWNHATQATVNVPATWRWPREHVFIKNVYSGFTDWCSDPDANNRWHETLDGSGYWQR